MELCLYRTAVSCVFLLLVRRKAVNMSEKYTVTCSPVTFSDMLYMKALKITLHGVAFDFCFSICGAGPSPSSYIQS